MFYERGAPKCLELAGTSFWVWTGSTNFVSGWIHDQYVIT